MENYISTVLNKIKDKKIKADIQSELEDHYNERVEYYTRIGYDKETAEAKANAHFGEDAEIIGEQLEGINANHIWPSVIFTIINILFFIFILWYALGASMLDAPFANGLFGSLAVLAFTVFTLAELLVSLRNKSDYLAKVGASGLVIIGALYQGYSPLVFGIYKIVKGEANRFLELMGSYNWRSASVVINILSIIFYIFCVALCLYAAHLSRKFQECEYEKRHINREKRLKRITAVTIVISIAMFAFILFTSPKHFEHFENFTCVYVIESDEKTDPAEIDDFNYNRLSMGWDFGAEYARDENDTFIDEDIFFSYMNEYDDDKDVVYGSYILYGEFQPTKKYVCVIPVTGKGTDFENYEWLDTSQGGLYVSECYNDLGSIIQCKVKILPREAQ